MKLDRSEIQESLFVVQLFVNKKMISTTKLNLSSDYEFVKSFSECVRGVNKDKLRKLFRLYSGTELIKKFSEICPEVSSRFKENFVNNFQKILGSINGFIYVMGRNSGDLAIETFFEKGIIFEIYAFRKFVDYGFSVMPRIKIDECEVDDIVFLGNKHACVVEVTTRELIKDDKLERINVIAENLQACLPGVQKVGKLIVGEHANKAESSVKQISFSDLEDRTKVLSAIYSAVSK